MERYYVIAINGQTAVDAGYTFCNGYCYRQLTVDGKFIAQIEVVVDEPGTYNGNPNKWVDAAYIKTGKDVEKALSALASIGFSGCPCLISKCTVSGCYEKVDEMCACII